MADSRWRNQAFTSLFVRYMAPPESTMMGNRVWRGLRVEGKCDVIPHARNSDATSGAIFVAPLPLTRKPEIICSSKIQQRLTRLTTRTLNQHQDIQHADTEETSLYLTQSVDSSGVRCLPRALLVNAANNTFLTFNAGQEPAEVFRPPPGVTCHSP
ncbi:hypothetical protein Bbelb_370580 [Branchiostoma belcheri]|nr:hypothetical protein Bbelb_370580 [Branchiostoma belcheri]